MKKAGKQVLAMLLAVVMVLSSATAVFADEAAPEISEPVTETELTEESDAASLNAEAAPQEAEPEAAEDPEAAELSEYLESLPLNAAAPEPYALDNSTTLADGEYPVDAANYSFTGGTGKARLTLSKVVVTDGRAYGHFAASSANMTHAFIGTSNTSDETAAIYDPATDTMAENVFKIENKAVVMPVDLNVEVPVACRTTAMSDPHWIQYRYTITLAEPEAPAEEYPIELAITNNTGMFKAVTASVEKDGEQLYLVMALSGTGYHELFAGTYEEAVANGDNRDNWVHGATNANGKWEFRFPITAETTYVPCVAISQSYLTKYDNGQGTLERAFYPRQFELNLEEKTLVTGDYDETMDVAVTSYLENFKVAETAKMRVVGGPNSNNYSCAPTLQMLDERYDSVTYPTVVSGKLSTATTALTAGKTFEISLLNAPGLHAFQDKAAIEMVFHVAGTEESETIPVTIDKMAKTIEIGEKLAEPTALEIVNNVKMFKPTAAEISADGESLVVTMGSTAFDKVFVGAANEAADASAIALSAENTFTFAMSAFEAAANGAVNAAFHSAKQDKWYNRLMTLDAQAKTLTFDDNSADYSAVEEALEKAWNIKMASYTDESTLRLNQAASEVVYGYNKSHQDLVDAMADRINDALNGLVLKTAVTDRYAGSNRYKTALAVAEQLKKQMGVKKFDAVVLCTGENYPDALAGGYLANVKNAPLLLIRGKAADKTNVTKYINNNLNKNGTVYVLGSTKAVPKSWISGIKSSFKIKRLAGSNRWGTNIEILKEAGLYEGMAVIVTNGYDYTDALCASALNLPLLIVNTKKNILTKDQKAYLKKFNKNLNFNVVGPSSVISDKLVKALKDYGTVTRIATDKDPVNRSVQIAQYYMPRPQTVTLVTSGGFADGLSGGILASRSGGLLLLVKPGKEAKAKAFVKDAGVREGLVLGLTKAVSDKSVKKILPDVKKIKVHEYKY